MANYYINAQVKVDSSTVQTQLNNIKTKSIKLDINSNSAKTATTNMKGLDNATKNVSKSILNLGGDFGLTFLKVSKFFLITKTIQTFTQGITEAVQVVKEFDDVLTDFKKVSDLSGESLDAYTEKLGELGSTVARTRKHFLREYTVMYI